jgi:hypothetical protein
MNKANEYPIYTDILELPYTKTLIERLIHAKKYLNEKSIKDAEYRLKVWTGEHFKNLKF